jgi:predicted nucleic acid-binding protein
MKFVDTSIFIRYLTDDIPEKAECCEKLFTKTVGRKEELITSELVIAEIIWVLESYYEETKEDVSKKVEKILNTPNLKCQNRELILRALILYTEKNIDYVDAYNAVFLKSQDLDTIYSYDKQYDRIDGVKRLEPA